jgi:hypothetical protein
MILGNLDVGPQAFRVQRSLVDHAGGDRNAYAVHHVLGHDAAAPRLIAGGRQGCTELLSGKGLRATPDLQEGEVVAFLPFAVLQSHDQAPIKRAAK